VRRKLAKSSEALRSSFYNHAPKHLGELGFSDMEHAMLIPCTPPYLRNLFLVDAEVRLAECFRLSTEECCNDGSIVRSRTSSPRDLIIDIGITVSVHSILLVIPRAPIVNTATRRPPGVRGVPKG
jgi:hypothetical protein